METPREQQRRAWGPPQRHRGGWQAGRGRPVSPPPAAASHSGRCADHVCSSCVAAASAAAAAWTQVPLAECPHLCQMYLLNFFATQPYILDPLSDLLGGASAPQDAKCDWVYGRMQNKNDGLQCHRANPGVCVVDTNILSRNMHCSGM